MLVDVQIHAGPETLRVAIAEWGVVAEMPSAIVVCEDGKHPERLVVMGAGVDEPTARRQLNGAVIVPLERSVIWQRLVLEGRAASTRAPSPERPSTFASEVILIHPFSRESLFPEGAEALLRRAVDPLLKAAKWGLKEKLRWQLGRPPVRLVIEAPDLTAADAPLQQRFAAALAWSEGPVTVNGHALDKKRTFKGRLVAEYSRE